MLVKRFHFSEVHLRGSLPFSYTCFQRPYLGRVCVLGKEDRWLPEKNPNRVYT